MSPAASTVGSRLADRLAFVTGGEGGIGSAIVDLFAREGATVVSIDVLPEARPDSPARRHDRVMYRHVDISSEEQVRLLLAETESQFGPACVLVNCAAIVGAGKAAHEVTEEEFDLLFRINVKGAWLMTKYAVPQMIAAGDGRIVNFSSIAGLVGGTSAQAIYHSTKGAIRAMSKADAITYARHGVRVNSVHPGSIDTPMSREAASKHPLGADEHSRTIIAKHPLGRRGRPEEVAYGVLYLASDESSFVTGAELAIDGGYSAQ